MRSNTFVLPSFESLYAGMFAYAADLLGTFRVNARIQSRDDEDLVHAMQRGDEKAFDLLYERYFDKMYAFVVRRVGHHQTAEDLVSDIFTKAFTHRLSFVWRTSFSAWIYRIATNRITDHHRTKRPTEEFDETKHDRPSTVPRAPDEIDREILRKKLETVLEKLTDRERLAVTMKFYGQCNNEEIAKVLRVTLTNVGVILHRALKKCQARYE